MLLKYSVFSFLSGWLSLLIFACILAIPRFYWMANGAYNSVVWIFLVMMLLPFVLLNAEERCNIGLVRPPRPARFLLAFVAGGLAAFAVYVIGLMLYGSTSPLHWYSAVRTTIMQRGEMIAAVQSTPSLFLVVLLPTVTFSPIGEELFFRGMMHDALQKRFSPNIALFLDAAIFGCTHIAHYGLVQTAGGVQILFPSVLWWVLIIAGTALLFSTMRIFAGTIWASVLCHAGFNAVMMWCIFFLM